MKANEAQQDESWMLARVGMFTASRAADLMARTKTGPSASRANLLTLLAVERITGQPVETYQNAAMQRGIDMEAEARDAYSFETGCAVIECGFITHDTLPHTGASPDGLIGDIGLVEIKCPANMEKHLDAIRTGAHAQEYRWQLQHQMLVTGRAWVDAVSYDPRFPDGLQLAITRVHRDEAAINELAIAITAANQEVEAIVSELRERILANAANRAEAA
jgi:putative phage-type endonuclease